MRFVLASMLCNSLLGVKQTRQQMRAQGAINANYPRGPGRTRVHRWVVRWWGSRVKCIQRIHSVAGLAAVKRLQQSGQVSISWPVTQWFHRVHICCVGAATQLPELTIRDSNSTRRSLASEMLSVGFEELWMPLKGRHQKGAEKTFSSLD